MKLLYYLILLACFACTANEQNEVNKWKAQAVKIEIIRDDFGVPHIYGKTDADAVFCLLYSQCEDDFNRVENNYIRAIGRLAEVEGEAAIYHDLRAHLFMTKEEAVANYNNSPEWLKKLCDAFADGVNYYLYTHPGVKPLLLTRFEPWMPMYFSEGSISGNINRISTNRIKAFYENKESLALNKEGNGLELLNWFDEPQGSNGFVLSGAHTKSGNTMLLINPHTSFFFRGEVHVVSEEGLNAYGALTWGQFFVYQGFNDKIGWMHTTTYTDVMDEFMEEVVKKEDGFYYQYGKEERPVETKEVLLRYKAEEEIKEKKFPMYRTHHGPVTHMTGDKWTATSMMWNPVLALQQSFLRTKKVDYKGFREMLDLKTNSSNNTFYADASGNIAYHHGNFLPKRDEQFDYSKPVDGSNPDTDWKGLHSVDEIISVVNPKGGWIQNCNSNPFTSAGEYSPKVEDYPYYMSLNRENFRGIHAVRLLEKAQNYTLDKLIETAYDPYLPAFEVLIPGLILAFDESEGKDESMGDAIDILRKWDFAVSTESVAMSLAHYYGILYLQKGIAPKGLSSMENITFFGIESPFEERLYIFKQTMDKLEEDFGTWNMPWGEINRYQRLNGAIRQPFNDNEPSIAVGMASGIWGALATFGARYHNNTKKIYGTRGNSFVAVVEFGDKVKAKTMLAGGQSGNPNSPHFSDQAQRYADNEFKDAAYYRDEVVARAEKIYHPGE
jgi:acyl-homoserine-lactone acylase